MFEQIFSEDQKVVLKDYSERLDSSLGETVKPADRPGFYYDAYCILKEHFTDVFTVEEMAKAVYERDKTMTP